MTRSRKIDVALALAFAGSGAALGGWTVWQYLQASFYQLYMPELVYSACGHGWVHAAVLPKALLDFLLMQTLTFDCANLPAPLPPLPENVFVKVHLYLAKFVDLVWRQNPLQYRDLWPVAAALVGFYVSGVFVLLRLFFSKPLSVLGATILMLSPIHIGMIVLLRDYGKAPFFVWGLVGLILAARAPSLRLGMLWAALSGIFIGVGYGFRQDVIIMLPVGLLLLATSCSMIRWRTHVAAAAIFTLLTIALAMPMLKVGHSGGFGAVLMQGLTDPFRKYLALDAPPYSFGPRYSDEFTLSAIAADMSVKDQGWEAREPESWTGMTQSVTRSGPYVLGWLGLFSGDMATQAAKSAMWVLGLPSLMAPERVATDWGVTFLTLLPPSQAGSYFYSRIGKSWLPWVGLAGMIAFYWQIWSARKREAVALAVIFGLLTSYTAVQFALRHVFHLEFLWVVAILALMRTPFQLRALTRSAPSFLALVAVTFAILWGIKSGLVAHQERSLREQFNALLNLPRERIDLGVEMLGNDEAFIRVPVPETARGMVESSPDVMDDTMGQRGAHYKVMASADRLLIALDSAKCPVQTLSLEARYDKRPNVWQPLDHQIEIGIASGTTHVLFPALYRATQHFAGIKLPKRLAGCIVSVERIRGETPLPSVLSAVFSPDWQKQPLHLQFGHFRLSPPLSAASK